MTYPMPRDNVLVDPTGAAVPGEAYRNEHDLTDQLDEETMHTEAAEEDDEGAGMARDEEASAAAGDQDDDADDETEAEADDETQAEADDETDAQADDETEAEAESDEETEDAAIADQEQPGGDDTDDGDVEEDMAAQANDVDVAAAGIPQQVAIPDPGLEEEEVEVAAPVVAETEVDAEPVEAVPAVAGAMHPGDADVPAEAASLASSDDFHDRWQQAQLGFIDDPRGAAEAARTLASEVLESHISALRDRQAQLDAWQSEATPDTEVLRAAMRAYRDMVKSLTAE